MKLNRKKALDLYLGGPLMFFLKPVVFLLGKILRRDHSLTMGKRTVFLKLQGGGSLLLAFPSILGLKKKFGDVKFLLVTTPPVRPFAESLGVFDEIVVIDDRNFLSMLKTGVLALVKCFAADTCIDLEVYSILSGVFSIGMLARNRIGFYLESLFWRSGVYTHLIFFNRFSASFHFYEQIAHIFEAEVAEPSECESWILRSLEEPTQSRDNVRRVGIGHGCSELGRERMLSAEQWAEVCEQRIDKNQDTELHFLGSAADLRMADEISEHIKTRFPKLLVFNRCGELNLAGSLALLTSLDEFWGIDSALLHYARLFRRRCLSFWGPTDPKTRLKEVPGLQEEVVYTKLPCSPCIHVTESPPCRGNNLCIKVHFDRNLKLQGGRVALPIFMPDS